MMRYHERGHFLNPEDLVKAAVSQLAHFGGGYCFH